MRYSNPVTGGYPMATIAAFIQLLPKGFRTERFRSTDATVFVAVEGRGRTRIGPDFELEWGPRDIFVVPSWKQVVHEASGRVGPVSRFPTGPYRKRCISSARSDRMAETRNGGATAASRMQTISDGILNEVSGLPAELLHWIPG